MAQIQLQMPDGVTVEEMNETYGRFVVQPLERGYGVTIGNAFRRVLLSSLSGTAITAAVRVDGVQHEFSTIPGVTEDVSDIILNLKGVRFKAGEEDEGSVSIHLEGQGAWTAKDIADNTADFEVLNPEHHIATLAEDADVRIDLRIEQGRGYVQADENKRDGRPDRRDRHRRHLYAHPERQVQRHPTRVGQDIDYERLTLEVETDGSVTAEDALTNAAAILRDHIGSVRRGGHDGGEARRGDRGRR